MKYRLSGAALAACLLPCASAYADNYTLASKLVSTVEHPLQVTEGLFSGVPTAVNMTNTGALDTTITSALPSGSNTIGAVNLGSLNGAATAANQSSVIGTKAAGTAAANSVLGGGVFNTTLPTLTNGQQAATQLDSSGRTIVVCASGCSGGTQFAEDATHASGDLGTLALVVRSDTAANTAGATGRYSALINDSVGRLWSHPQTAAGDFADGWDATQGAKADAAWSSGSGSVISLLKTVAGAAIDTTTPSPVKIDQTTPGTTNGVQGASESATGSAVPAKASFTGANSGGNLTGIIQADNSAAISVSTATTTQIVALASSKKIYVTSLDVIAGGTGNIKFVYGTGSNCGTGTTDLTGAYNLTAQAGIAKGGGLGPVLVVPASNALCVTTSAAVQMSGSVAYTQF